jgi:hypothetical protein
MFPEFLKQEQDQRMAAEKIAAEKEAKRLIARNEAKVGVNNIFRNFLLEQRLLLIA